MANKRNRIEVTDDYSSVHVRPTRTMLLLRTKLSITFIINEEIVFSKLY